MQSQSLAAVSWFSSLEEVDWKESAKDFFQFGIDQTASGYEKLKSKSYMKGFKKVFTLCEIIPFINFYLSRMRLALTAIYAFWALSKTITTRTYDEGFKSSFHAFFTQDLPFILKHTTRGFFIASRTHGKTSTLFTSFLTYSYDYLRQKEAFQYKLLPNYLEDE